MKIGIWNCNSIYVVLIAYMWKLNQDSYSLTIVCKGTRKKINSRTLKNMDIGISLKVHWLRLHTASAGDMGLIPGQGTKIPYAAAATAKSLQSCPTLYDPIDGSQPGSAVPGFSKQEHWIGLPFPSPMHESEK